MGRPVVHWEIGAQDAAKLQRFYADLFEWTINASNPMSYGFVDTGGQGGINGGIMQTERGMPPYITFYVHVDDLKSYLEKAERLGGKTLVPPTPIPNIGAFAMFADPEGHCVGLVKE